MSLGIASGALHSQCVPATGQLVPQLIDVQKEQAAEGSHVERPGMTRDAGKERGKVLGFLGTLGDYC